MTAGSSTLGHSFNVIFLFSGVISDLNIINSGIKESIPVSGVIENSDFQSGELETFTVASAGVLRPLVGRHN